jgi:serine-type D-Ala-D-Ala carboxypeptidase/endopeptidase (penicillin-binding protein 4)
MKLFCFILLQVQSLYSNSLQSFVSDFQKNMHPEIQISVFVKKTSNDSTMFSYNSDLNLPPASTLKLLSTGLAFQKLGSQFRFKSNIILNGQINEGIFTGKIIIDTQSDPSFGSKRFNLNPEREIILALKNKDIKAVKGEIEIISDNNTFKVPLSWQIGDIGNYFGAFPMRFNFDENIVSYYFDAKNMEGQSADLVKTEPLASNWEIINQVKIGPRNSGDQVNVISIPGNNTIILIGTIPAGARSFKIKGANPTPVFTFKENLKSELLKNQISFNQEIPNDSLLSKFDTLTVLESPKLEDIITECNHKSVNFFADGLGVYLTELENSDFESFYRLKAKERDIDFSKTHLIDGSGLSASNLISTRNMCDFLQKLSTMSDFNSFLKTIPIVGKSGTVKYLDPRNKTNGKIYAKSGTISGVKNYSGYFFDDKNEIYSFAFYCSGINDTAQSDLRNFTKDFFSKLVEIK